MSLSEQGLCDSEEFKFFQVFTKKMITSFPVKTWRMIWRVGQEDPRKIVHSLKVGTALALVSLLFLLEPLFAGIGKNALWAVMTVSLVLEFTVGATLCKGLNRGLGTLLAGSLAFFMEYVADEAGRVLRAVFIGSAVFLIGTAATYLRFFPYIKKNYDYGVVIFLLTFNLITVSSYRVSSALEIAKERSYNIAIGCSICLIMTLMLFPNWSGDDLHNSFVSKLEGLARSVEACIKEYFQDAETIEENSFEDSIYKGYKLVLDSRPNDETLALHASWEPKHLLQCHRYTWKQYLKLGDVLRHFGYTAIALHGCLQSKIQTPKDVQALFRNPCIRVAEEVAKVLMELADSIRNRRSCLPDLLSDNLNEALQELNNIIKSQPRLFLSPNNHAHANTMFSAATEVTIPKQGYKDTPPLLERQTSRVADPSIESEQRVLRLSSVKIAMSSLEFSEALPFAAFASLLVEMVVRLDLVINQVEELGRMANFKELKKPNLDKIVVACESNKRENHPTQLQPNLGSVDIE